jgi:hypothetical protein
MMEMFVESLLGRLLQLDPAVRIGVREFATSMYTDQFPSGALITQCSSRRF